MNVAICEDLPLIRSRLQALFASHSHRDRIFLFPPQGAPPLDLVLWDGPRFTPRLAPEAALTLVPFSAAPLSLPKRGLLLTGGMCDEACVSFSSIGEDSALLCVARELVLRGEEILPFEKKVPFDRSFSLYKNLAAGLALCLADLYFGEES